MSELAADGLNNQASAPDSTRRWGSGERCPKCNGVRGKVIARVPITKMYNDGFQVHQYRYLRLTH
ncbi:MAG: hypothetical protein OK456_09635, partial [Thaumarchaeota archaeon]|nr:hypothetical protein [Nitrososphaerota archaeon]